MEDEANTPVGYHIYLYTRVSSHLSRHFDSHVYTQAHIHACVQAVLIQGSTPPNSTYDQHYSLHHHGEASDDGHDDAEPAECHEVVAAESLGDVGTHRRPELWANP